ncbi:hypothetical protein O3M35_004973 [Rhynocoris fuscipes]|uniref:Mic1 domain-containing protein n=1 Tax=Rhynocoris fuscipes TaxID=488301 RepID=A0AAW1DH17_9HEMI
MALNAEVLLCHGEEEESDYYLQFSKDKITFEGVNKSQLTNVFFDESNSQVFSMKSGDVTEVTVKSPDPNFCKKFKIEEKGRVISIKFSPDQSILSLQRTETAVEFLTFSDGNVTKEFTENFKGNNLLGYIWTSKNEVVFVTATGIKLCKVDVNSGTVNSVKSLSININWFTFYSPICLVLLNIDSPHGNSMQLLQIKQNQILKLAKFDVDCDSVVSKLKKNAIAERDVALGVVYNQPRILFMNYQAINTGIQTEVIVYTIIKLAAVKKTDVLRIHQRGSFALNLVDNLIIVHNQFMKSSLVFDITDAEFQGVVRYHLPVIDPKSIKPFEEEQPSNSNEIQKHCELYSPNWIMFQPNIVMDVKAGCLWTLELILMGFYKYITDRKELIKFLLLRSNSKFIIARTLSSLMDEGGSRLEELAEIFDQINAVYRNYLEQNMKSQIGLPSSMSKPDDDPVVEFRAVIDQSFIYTYVFCKLAEKVYYDSNKKQSRLLSWTLLEYIRSLADLQIPAQHFLYELLINCLVLTESYYQLHQLLQYHGVSDSKPLACLLLSLENVYPAAPQLALDMLERLGTAKEEISEILLSRGEVLPSLRYATIHCGPHTSITPNKYLEVARQKGDERLYRSLIKHFDSKPHYRNGT